MGKQETGKSKRIENRLATCGDFGGSPLRETDSSQVVNVIGEAVLRHTRVICRDRQKSR